MKAYVKLLRIKHWIKNGLVLLPLVFYRGLSDISMLRDVLRGTIAFCFLSSMIYIFNDIQDMENDRNHSVKCSRPIASGAVSVKSAWVWMAILAVGVIAINFSIDKVNWQLWLILIAYLLLNILYSLGLKNVPIWDVAILMSGFMLRVLYGGLIVNIAISGWLYLTVIAFSFYLGLGKRRNELAEKNNTRKVLKFYNYNFLDKNMYMCMALAVTFYSLWTVDTTTVQKVGGTQLVWTVPLVILICMKYSLIIEGDSDGDPVEVVFRDKTLLVLVAIFGMVVLGIIYL